MLKSQLPLWLLWQRLLLVEKEERHPRKHVVFTKDKNNFYCSNLITLHMILIIHRHEFHLGKSQRSKRGIEFGAGLTRKGSVKPAFWFLPKVEISWGTVDSQGKISGGWRGGEAPRALGEDKCIHEGILSILAGEAESLNPGPARPE